MQVTTVCPGVTVYNSRAAVEMASVVVELDGEIVLVDPGILPDEVERIARDAGARPVSAVVLTHAHWDHVGAVGRWPGAAVVAHLSFVAWLGRVEAEEPLNASRAHAWAKAGLAAPAPIPPPVPTRTVDEGDALGIGEARFLHLPGHLGDAIGLHLPARGLVICGDILDSVELPLPLQDVDAYLVSLARLRALLDAGVEHVVPGHGPPLGREAARAQVARDDAYVREVVGAAEAALAAGEPFEAAKARFAAMSWWGKGVRARDEEHWLNAAVTYAQRARVCADG